MRRDVEGRELQGDGRTPISPPVEGVGEVRLEEPEGQAEGDRRL